MARIRTIKPEFFTSEDIVARSPLARLLYVALWCEADREGRLIWKPKTFKIRYFPADDCDIDQLCNELLAAGLVCLYGDGFAYIPKFGLHQHLNPREATSTLPVPTPSLTRGSRVSTRVSTVGTRVNTQGSRVSDAQGGREGNVYGKDASLPTRLPKDWEPGEAGYEYALKAGLANGRVAAVLEGFRDHWLADATPKAKKLDWHAAWRTWVRKAIEFSGGKPGVDGDPFKGAH